MLAHCVGILLRLWPDSQPITHDKQLITTYMNTKSLLILIPAAVFALSCKKTAPVETAKIPINIAASVTKVTDTALETGDAVGIYVVNTPSTLSQSGNHADNVKFTYDGSKWVAEKQLYWLDDTTPADFYAYFPYSASASVSAHSFSVQQDQSTEAGYKASEFLCGSNKGVSPTPDPVSIITKHILSCLRIELMAGTGWADSDISAASVTVTGLKTAAKINLADASVSADGSAADIQPLSLGGGVFKAIVVPQTVSDSDLLKVRVGDNDYTLKTSLDIASGKQHKCTLVINRTNEGINIGVDPWEDGDYINDILE